MSTNESFDTGQNRMKIRITLDFNRNLSKRMRRSLNALLAAIEKVATRLPFVNASVEIEDEYELIGVAVTTD